MVLAQTPVSNKSSLSEKLLGTDRWREMLTEFQGMLRWSGITHREAARKHQACADAYGRAVGVRLRGDERIHQVVHRADRKLEKLDDSDTEQRENVVEAGRREVRAVSAAAVKSTDKCIREVLDLDANLAAVSVAQWLEQQVC